MKVTRYGWTLGITWGVALLVFLVGLANGNPTNPITGVAFGAMLVVALPGFLGTHEPEKQQAAR